MTTTGQETLLDYTPTQEEEISRLKGLAEKRTLQMQALLEDPSFKQFEATQKAMSKKLSEFSKLREEHKEITKKLKTVLRPTIEVPTEDGFYVLKRVQPGWGRSDELRTERALMLKAMGTWFNMKNGDCLADMGNRWRKKETFADFCEIDDETIEISIERLEDQSRYPAELLKDEDDEDEFDDLDADEDVVDE